MCGQHLSTHVWLALVTVKSYCMRCFSLQLSEKAMLSKYGQVQQTDCIMAVWVCTDAGCGGFRCSCTGITMHTCLQTLQGEASLTPNAALLPSAGLANAVLANAVLANATWASAMLATTDLAILASAMLPKVGKGSSSEGSLGKSTLDKCSVVMSTHPEGRG